MTLTGPGGIGKTRLAVAVGKRLRHRFDVGTAFVLPAAITRSGPWPRSSAMIRGCSSWTTWSRW